MFKFSVLVLIFAGFAIINSENDKDLFTTTVEIVHQGKLELRVQNDLIKSILTSLTSFGGPPRVPGFSRRTRDENWLKIQFFVTSLSLDFMFCERNKFYFSNLTSFEHKNGFYFMNETFCRRCGRSECKICRQSDVASIFFLQQLNQLSWPHTTINDSKRFAPIAEQSNDSKPKVHSWYDYQDRIESA